MEKIIEETACLEACNQIHEIDALRDNLVEVADAQERGNEPYIDERPSYFPPEPVGHLPKNSNILYHYYLINLEQKFVYDIPVHDIVLVLRNKLEAELGSLHFDLHVDRGRLTVNLKYVGEINLTTDQVLLCRRFQKTLLRVLIDHDLKSLNEHMDGDILGIETEYFLLPATAKHQRPVIIDWPCVNSVLFSCKKNGESHLNCSLPESRARIVHTKDGPVCTCLLQNSLVYTPHTDQMYCTTGILELNANSRMKHQRRGKINTYKKYYEERHGIKLCFEHESLVRGRPLFRVKYNYLQRCRNQEEKESSMPSFELPPELCYIFMSPISINTFYSFSFVPSIMHRLESLLKAANLKMMHLDHCKQNDVLPISKVLEANSTKKCQETFDLESLEPLGDSFLKYAKGLSFEQTGTAANGKTARKLAHKEVLLKSLKESKAFSGLSSSHSELSSGFEISGTVQMATATTSTGFKAVAKRKPVFIKVDQLKPGTQGHTLVVKVVSSNAVKVTNLALNTSLLSRPLQYSKPLNTSQLSQSMLTSTSQLSPFKLTSTSQLSRFKLTSTSQLSRFMLTSTSQLSRFMLTSTSQLSRFMLTSTSQLSRSMLTSTSQLSQPKPLNTSLLSHSKPLNTSLLSRPLQYPKTQYPVRISECLVGDETGTIIFTARSDQVDIMKPGATVVLWNAKIKMFKGFMRIAVDKSWGRVEVTEPANFDVKEDNNLSLVKS